MTRLFLLAFIVSACFHVIEGTVVRSGLGERLITGKVTHAGSGVITPGSNVLVELRDTTLMDKAAQPMAVQLIVNPKTFPIPYELKYNQAIIKPGHSYSMSARINGPDKSLQFINDVHTPAVLTNTGASGLDIAVIKTGGASPSTKLNKPDQKGKVCPPVRCPGGKPKKCTYGYQKLNGCEICKCHEPCSPPGKNGLCGPKERCVVDKKPDGTFEARCDSPKLPGSSSGKPSGKQDEKTVKAACVEHKLIGRCRGAIPRFHYNPASNSCEPFSYGGCGGNSNNFVTKYDCEIACKT